MNRASSAIDAQFHELCVQQDKAGMFNRLRLGEMSDLRITGLGRWGRRKVYLAFSSRAVESNILANNKVRKQPFRKLSLPQVRASKVLGKDCMSKRRSKCI